MTIEDLEYVFVHSYSSDAWNWREVMLGVDGQEGRVTRAVRLANELGLPIVANDRFDKRNGKLYRELGIENLKTARNTNDEVVSALEKSKNGTVLFVSSPDHLPRIVRDALSAGGNRCLFAASDVPFSEAGAKGISVAEPEHK